MREAGIDELRAQLREARRTDLSLLEPCQAVDMFYPLGP